MKRPIISIFAAGAALSISACSGKNNAPEYTNPPPPPIKTGNPPAPHVEPEKPVEASKLPTWDQVKSDHPEGATNPPFPVLIVTPDEHCFKTFEGGMLPPGPDRVQECPADTCGTEVQCPEKAQELLTAWREGKDPKKPSVETPGN